MHHLLKQQLQDVLGEHADLEQLPDPWAEFVQRVDDTYTHNGVAPDKLRDTPKNLAQERNLLASILDYTTALVILLDADGYILRFNTACENASGYQAAEVIGQTFCDVFVLPDQRDVMLSVFKRMRHERANMSFKSQWMTRHKRIRLLEWSNAVLVNDDNDV
jgi:PAS domain S-box-containing protein